MAESPEKTRKNSHERSAADRGSLFDVYRRMFSRRPVLVVIMLFIYAAGVGGFLFKWTNTGSWESQKSRDLRLRIQRMEMKGERDDAVIDVLRQRMRKVSFLKDLTFDEKWKSDETRTTVLRLLEYAQFALEKSDFSYAKGVYQDAAKVQPTLSVPYYLGRLHYLEGDLVSAESEWTTVIAADPQGKYPDLRLYLGILKYELGKKDESNTLLQEYLGWTTETRNEPDTTRTRGAGPDG